MKVLIITTIGDVHYPEDLCTVSPLRALLSTALNIPVLFATLMVRKPPWGGNMQQTETCPELNKSRWVESGDTEPWMDAGRTARTSSSCLEEQLGSIMHCANSLWFGFPLGRRGQILYSVAAVGFQPLGCVSGLSLPLCDAPFWGWAGSWKRGWDLLDVFAAHWTPCGFCLWKQRQLGAKGYQNPKHEHEGMSVLSSGAPSWSVTGY